MNVLAFIGSVREPHRMVEAIDVLSGDPRAPERTILSTWFGEVGRYTGLRSALLDRGVDIIEANEPIPFRADPLSFIHRGHIYHQKFALTNALAEVDPGDWLVKSRPDLKFHDASKLGALLHQPATPVLPAIRPFVDFDTRLVVGRLSLGSPFWLDDTHFASRAATMSCMTALDASYDISRHPHVAIPEIRFFHALFAERFPVIEQLMKLPFNFGFFHAHGERDAFLRIALTDTFFAKALYAYFCLSAAAFDLGGVFGELDEQVDRIVMAHQAEFAHLCNGDVMHRLHAECRLRSDANLFEALSGDSFASSGEWQACVDKLWGLGAIEMPRIAMTPGRRSDVHRRSGEVVTFGDERAVAATRAGNAEAVLRYLDAILSRAGLSAFLPDILPPGGSYQAVGVVRLSVGDVIWNDALSVHPLEIAFGWTQDDRHNVTWHGGIGLAESIVSDWVFFLPLSAPRTPGIWRVLISLSSPTLNVRWQETEYVVQIRAAEEATS